MSNWANKSAVEHIIEEAMDAVALDHIAKLNTAHLSSSSSSLPSNLESRFRKLKSFPTSSSTTVPTHKLKSFNSPSSATVSSPKLKSFNSSSSSATVPSPKLKSFNSSSTDPITTPTPASPPTNTPLNTSLPDLHSDGLSPSKRRDISPVDKQGCCFPFSPKIKSRGINGNEGVYDLDKKMLEEIKEQQRKLKKALKEQEKVSKEAAKMVKFAKTASARMTRDIFDDLFSDDEDDVDKV